MRLFRNVFRGKRKHALRNVWSPLGGSGLHRTNWTAAELTLGRGENALGGTVKSLRGLLCKRHRQLMKPYALLPGSATARSATSSWTRKVADRNEWRDENTRRRTGDVM